MIRSGGNARLVINGRVLVDSKSNMHEMPVAWEQLHEHMAGPFYKAPRPWVGLTKEEAKEISLANRPYVIDMIAELEARLKEKNT